jgi:hypothetical protein
VKNNSKTESITGFTLTNAAMTLENRHERRVSNKIIAVTVFIILTLLVMLIVLPELGVIYTIDNQMTASGPKQYYNTPWSYVTFQSAGGKSVTFEFYGSSGGPPAYNQSQQVIHFYVTIEHSKEVQLNTLDLNFSRGIMESDWIFANAEYRGITGFEHPFNVIPNATTTNRDGMTNFYLQNWGFLGSIPQAGLMMNLTFNRLPTGYPGVVPSGTGYLNFQISPVLQDSGVSLVTNTYHGSAFIQMTLLANGTMTTN